MMKIMHANKKNKETYRKPVFLNLSSVQTGAAGVFKSSVEILPYLRPPIGIVLLGLFSFRFLSFSLTSSRFS